MERRPAHVVISRLSETKGVPHMSISPIKIDELVINWHITEACNYRCKYCFAAWEGCQNRPELWRNESDSRTLLDSVHRFFSAQNSTDALRSHLSWSAVRLSLAGGEPTLLGKKLVRIGSHAKDLGFRLSLITNGSKPDVVSEMAKYIDLLGISIDSVKQDANAFIGRSDGKGQQISPSDLEKLIAQVRQNNPMIRIKLNTVVNAGNADNDLSELIARTRPDRWKIMRMLPSITDALHIDREAFWSFVRRHQDLGPVMSVEDNTDMTQSYLMIDPHGRFFQNEAGRVGYAYSPPILEVGLGRALQHIDFQASKFAARYPSSLVQEV